MKTIWERAEEHEAWVKGVREIAENNPNAYEIKGCCPCVRFEQDGYGAVAYLHSDNFEPKMLMYGHTGGAGEWMSLDYLLMLDVLRGHFGVA